jgi:hypothetical protein
LLAVGFTYLCYSTGGSLELPGISFIEIFYVGIGGGGGIIPEGTGGTGISPVDGAPDGPEGGGGGGGIPEGQAEEEFQLLL